MFRDDSSKRRQYLLEQGKKMSDQNDRSVYGRGSLQVHSRYGAKGYENPEEYVPPNTHFKLRFVIGALIFAAFVYMDQNHLELNNYSSKQISKVIEKNTDVSSVMKFLPVQKK